jgi:hypothetical protein
MVSCAGLGTSGLEKVDLYFIRAVSVTGVTHDVIFSPKRYLSRILWYNGDGNVNGYFEDSIGWKRDTNVGDKDWSAPNGRDRVVSDASLSTSRFSASARWL